MNAISPSSPDAAFLCGQEHRMIRGELWNDVFVWGHRQGMSDLHVQTNHRLMIDVHGRLRPATRRTITAEETASAGVVRKVPVPGNTGK